MSDDALLANAERLEARPSRVAAPLPDIEPPDRYWHGSASVTSSIGDRALRTEALVQRLARQLARYRPLT